MPELLTLSELSTQVRVSERTVRRMIGRGAGPVLTRIGRKRFVATPDAREWLAGLRQSGAQVTA